MKQKLKATVQSHRMIAEGIYDLWIETELAKEAHAGQFVGVYTKDSSKLLPRPISICEVSDNRDALRLVYRIAGEGTADISRVKPFEEIEILGILGNGYCFEEIFKNTGLMTGDYSKLPRVLLLGGGIGIPPMLELAKELDAHGIKPTVIAGYRNDDLFLNRDLMRFGRLEIATEDGSVGTKGNVLNVVDNLGIKSDIIMACGPMPMLRAIKKHVESLNNNGESVKAYISLEERMACGVGACLGCVCKTSHKDSHSNVDNARICTDGPVFDCEDVMI